MVLKTLCAFAWFSVYLDSPLYTETTTDLVYFGEESQQKLRDAFKTYYSCSIPSLDQTGVTEKKFKKIKMV